MFNTRIKAVIAAFAFSALVLSAGASFADEPKVPMTAADHQAMEKQYRDEAAQYRKVADEHRTMAQAYAKSHPDPKSGKNQWTAKMQKHCEALTKDAEKLAADADKAAEFHMMRAKELQGK